jgi:tetratricopeptide (TPR) repeat protein
MPPFLHALVAAALALSCAAAPRQTWHETTPPEVLVEVLPRAALVALDGVALGLGARTVAVPDPGRRYRFRVSAQGFVPAEREGEGAQLAGARLGIALRPEGFGSARPLELDDGEGLAAAAALLERRGAHRPALEYAERAAEAAPEVALGQRVLGDAASALGQRRRAIDGYSAYLRLAPEAPDRVAVAARLEALRGDVALPLQEHER